MILSCCAKVVSNEGILQKNILFFYDTFLLCQESIQRRHQGGRGIEPLPLAPQPPTKDVPSLGTPLVCGNR